MTEIHHATTTSAATIKTEAELFDALGKLGIETVTVTFSAGWDCPTINDVTVHPDINIKDFREAVTDIAEEKAKTLGYGYDTYRRYDEGEYYQGTDEDDDGTVLFDIPARTISLDATARVRVVEYRNDAVSKTWQLDVFPEEHDGAE
jgi:hypothetical protein